MLYVECYPDEMLARTLGVPRRELRHERGKGNILNRLRKVSAGKGMVDEDPDAHQPQELQKYREVGRKGRLVLMQHTTNPAKQLILISPRLEEWLYERASDCGVNPKDYGLPGSADELHDTPHYEANHNFEEFLRQLQKDDEVQCLKRWIG